MDDENTERNGTVLHVLDLPQLYTKPSAQDLLNTLTLLTSEPPSWEGSDTEDDETPMTVKSARRQSMSAVKAQPVQINPEGLATYLTRIIASDLRWIDDDSVKEDIWEAASIRLSERSGRTAMGAISRKFRIPAAKDGPSEDMEIYEPALTADNLGLKTWASSYLLSRRLWRLAADESSLPGAKDLPRHSVLELGSGTGLVGLSAAMVLGTDVLLTDLPEIVENLDRNAVSNGEILDRHNGSAHTAVLDWTDPSCMELSLKAVKEADYQESQHFRFIFAADPLYSPEHPGWLAQAILARLSREADARVVIELPLRTAYQPQVEEFLNRMQAAGLKICNEGYETGYDDWGSQGGRKAVRCWWTVWSWKTAYFGECHAVEHDEITVQANDMGDSHRQLLAEFKGLDDWD
ncbi:putative glucose-inducible sam-dependent methyltransferase [Diplodia seriata]|uniref:Putative glucose-inducible sam-dependent methyltransferase n=1 Tax=Diplodia seriata TaxID=420778 RepID=A0A0G2EUQ9_9PEZI|nr:putative glucose-inducible sam-dependent methyltransferase [Diplodia seriata]